MSDLCTNCGLCCSRLFFTWVSVADDELANLPAPIRLNAKSADKIGFSLPCPAVQDCKCTVYEQRPRPCRNFECDLLKDLTDGRTTLDSAQEVVAETKRLVDSLNQELPPVPDGAGTLLDHLAAIVVAEAKDRANSRYSEDFFHRALRLAELLEGTFKRRTYEAYRAAEAAKKLAAEKQSAAETPPP